MLSKLSLLGRRTSSELNTFSKIKVNRINKINNKRNFTSSLNKFNINSTNGLKKNNINSISLYSNKFFSTEAKPEETKAPEESQVEAKPEETKSTATEEKKEETVVPPSKEKVVGDSQSHDFQAETRKLLDIVARSLYTDKEVFVRELVSNASDALEKVRHKMLVGEPISDSHLNLEINIWADDKKTITIQDHGVGMTKEELMKNLGSIGFSGSLEYIKNAKDKDLTSIIGQFGVGFYSSFMVGDKVTVYSKSANPDAKGYCWVYDGSGGSYSIAEADGVERGTKIVIELNDKSTKFAQKDLAQKIIQKYSNFVGFKIKLNGNQINTLKPIWTLNKGEVTEKDHKEFYQFLSHGYDNPRMHLHFTTDSPLNIRAIFYIGDHSGERFGMGRMESGVNLYSRKVMIQSKAKGILPEWLRFVKGVVDSEDIPLNLSREHLQDSALIQRINTVLTKRILKWLDDEANKDSDKYVKFYNEYSDFLREGLFAESPFREEIGKLLRFESSKMESGKLTSFDEYISRMKPDQKDIFYVVVPNRSLAEASPYFETFKQKDVEVLFSYNTRFDDYALAAILDYKKKTLTTIESTKAISAIKDIDKAKDADKKAEKKISENDMKDLIAWMKDSLGPGKVASVKESERLVESPAIIAESDAGFRRINKFIDPNKQQDVSKQHLEINGSHEIIVNLNTIRKEKPNLALLVLEQVFDDALISAGLLDDPRPMLPRLNTLLRVALKSSDDTTEVVKKAEKPAESSTSTSTSTSESTPKTEESNKTEEGTKTEEGSKSEEGSGEKKKKVKGRRRKSISDDAEESKEESKPTEETKPTEESKPAEESKPTEEKK